MKTFRILGLFCVLLAWTSRASAALILVHDNGGPNHPSGVISDAVVPFEVGDDFNLSSSTSIAKVTWYGAYSGGDLFPDGPDHFSIRFFSFTGPTTPSPSPMVDLLLDSVFRTITPLTFVNGARIFSYEAEIPLVELNSGHYLLSIVNNTTGQADRWAWALHSTVSGGDMWQRFNNGANWLGPFGSEMSFKIFAVPEPGTGVGVLVLGLLAVGRRGRR